MSMNAKDSLAQFDLAMRYYSQKDYQQAFSCFTQAYNSGSTDAAFYLGYLCYHGLGVSKNDSDAAKFYERAAAFGHGKAQFNLGVLYLNGKGVSRDNNKASYWITKAAVNGSVKAQSWLAKKVFTECINKFLSDIDSENKLLVFKGFTLDFYNALNSCKLLSHISGNWDGLYPDARKINAGEILSYLVTSSGLKWCFYEEFAALSIILNDLSVYKGKIIVIANDLFESYYPVDSSIPVEVFESESSDSGEALLQKYYSDYKSEHDNFLASFIDRHSSFDGIQESGFFSSIESDNNNFDSELEPVNINISELQNIKCELMRGRLHDKTFCIESEQVMNLPDEISRLNTLGAFYNVKFSFREISALSKYDPDEYLYILNKYWGDNASFRSHSYYKSPSESNNTHEISQGSIISDIITQSCNALSGEKYSDIIITAPTNAGKSLLFQIPGIYFHEDYQESALVIIISPLVALMADQVSELQTKRGIDYATFINGNITWEERRERINGIKSGRYSIIYFSPEFLITCPDIKFITGERKIALLVVDEAHLVTSWGRDFRIDYLFMGDFIHEIRTSRYNRLNFPVLCLTATAVYGGRNDIITGLQESLHLSCYSGHLYLGSVCRKNIIFDIRHPDGSKSKHEDSKKELVSQAAVNFVRDNIKAIIYFPYTTQIEEIYKYLESNYPDEARRISKYHGDMDALDKDTSYKNFASSDSLVMLATKAFGMGINIGDINTVYHYAPSGDLADYVQEIGRAARRLENGYAVTDYLKNDMKFTRILWSLSGLSYYQVREIAKKLYAIYKDKGSKNILLSPETFEYLFSDRDSENKLRSGLLFLRDDLAARHNMDVMKLRAKSLFSTQYILVPYEVEEIFKSEYGEYCKLMQDSHDQNIYVSGRTAPIIETKLGNIFEIDLASLWGNKFADLTFQHFKYKFFTGELFTFTMNKAGNKGRVVPHMRIIIKYDKGYDNIKSAFMALAAAIQDSFLCIRDEFSGRKFTLRDFSQAFRANYKGEFRHEYIKLLLDLFCYPRNGDFTKTPAENWKFIERSGSGGEDEYCIRTKRCAYIRASLQNYFAQSAPNESAKEYVSYIAMPDLYNSAMRSQQLMASLLQLFEMASYEITGGQKPQMFIELREPEKLIRTAGDHAYKNSVLADIASRHDTAIDIMQKFMSGNFTSEERWALIEQYFLGHDEIVDAFLDNKS